MYLTTHSPYDDLEVRAMYLQWKSDVGADSRGMPNNLHANAIRDMCAEHCNMQCPEDIDVLQRLLLNSFDRLKVAFAAPQRLKCSESVKTYLKQFQQAWGVHLH